MVAMKKVYLVPLFAFVLALVTFLITYAWSVANQHVLPLFPYISETGSKPPESCIMAQGLNFAAFLMSIAIYIKYRQVIEFSVLRPNRGICLKKNFIAAVFGGLSCLGLDIVANFQESNILVVHMIGAGLCFISGTIYFCMQTTISRKMCPEICSKRTFYIRCVLCGLCIVLALTTGIPGGISISKFTGDDRRRWAADEGGYTWHLISTFSEWLLVLFFCSFIASYVLEFRHIVVDRPIIRLTNVEPELASKSNGTSITSIDIKV